jgi:hypothetical protein
LALKVAQTEMLEASSGMQSSDKPNIDFDPTSTGNNPSMESGCKYPPSTIHTIINFERKHLQRYYIPQNTP